MDLDQQKQKLKSLWKRLEHLQQKYPNDSYYQLKVRNEIYSTQDKIAEYFIKNKIDIKFDYNIGRTKLKI